MLNPKSHGFSDRAIAIDRCQLILLRMLSLHYANRIVLKGGMAMRALFGSLRLTKDLDFDRDPSVSNDSLGNTLPKTMVAAALESGLLNAKATISKRTRTTVRASLHATQPGSGQDIYFDVEISGRGLPPPRHIRSVNVSPPGDYFLAPFGVSAFDADAMAAAKVAALHSDQRSVPRDVFDLQDLIAQGANPVELLANADREWLRGLQSKAIEKTALISWNRANEELFPYLPMTVAQSINQSQWDEICLKVALKVDDWVEQALQMCSDKDTQ